MGLFSSTTDFAWTHLESQDQLSDLIVSSNEKPVLFFKHSTRCSVSRMALSQFEQEWNAVSDCNVVFLDLLQYRELSNAIVSLTGVQHESPQTILLKNGKVVAHASHYRIDASTIQKLL